MLNNFKLILPDYQDLLVIKNNLNQQYQNKIIRMGFISVPTVVFSQKDLVLDDISGEVEIYFESHLTYLDIISVIPKNINFKIENF